MIELIPKEERKPTFGQIFFLIVSFALFASVGVGFVVVKQLTADSREALEILERVIVEDTRPQEQKLERELIGYRDKVVRVRAILEGRKDVLAFFDILEDTIHPDVFFTKLDANVKDNTIIGEGRAKNFFVLEQQRLVWKGREEFREVEVRQISLEQDGKTGFEVRFVSTSEFMGTP